MIITIVIIIIITIIIIIRILRMRVGEWGGTWDGLLRLM